MKSDNHLFTQCWRWYGPNDPVSLSDIRQAGASGIVSALHQIPIGETWEPATIKERKILIETAANGISPLKWEVVESLPVHDDIKRGAPERDKYIRNYCQSIRYLAQNDIRVICYNFMPVLDWLRTDLAYPMPNGARSLRFEYLKLIVFDRFILQRPDAIKDYSSEQWNEAGLLYKSMGEADKNKLKETISLGLPGGGESFSLNNLHKGIGHYRGIDATQLRENLVYFLKQVVPVAEAEGVKLAIHPDDPPWPVFGLPRIVSKQDDLDFLLQSVDSTANGLTFCSGSLGALPENQLSDIARKWEHRIHFLHLRSVSHSGYRNFMEADHLEGNADLFTITKAIWEKRIERLGSSHPEFRIPMRPDHGMQMLDDLQKSFYPGYSAIGRLRGLAELRGLEIALGKFLNSNQKHIEFIKPSKQK